MWVPPTSSSLYQIRKLPLMAAEKLDERVHVPFVDELEHGKHAQPGDPEQRHRR
jgi:hypothetical protein